MSHVGWACGRLAFMGIILFYTMQVSGYFTLKIHLYETMEVAIIH